MNNRHLILSLAAFAMVAIAAPAIGGSGGPTAQTAISKKKTKKIAKRIAKKLDKRAIKSIPAGPKGDQGPGGPQGPKGDTGPQGPPGAGLTPANFTEAVADLPDGSCAGTPDGWYNEIGAVHDGGYYRDPSGMVYLRGIVTKCGGSAPDTIFTLPAGQRPELQSQFAAATESFDDSDGTGFATIIVQADGQVQIRDSYPPGIATWVSLDGIVFRCGPAATNGCP